MCNMVKTRYPRSFLVRLMELARTGPGRNMRNWFGGLRHFFVEIGMLHEWSTASIENIVENPKSYLINIKERKLEKDLHLRMKSKFGHLVSP